MLVIDPASPSRILSDLGTCTPAGAVTDYPSRYTWHAVPFETETISGTMLAADGQAVVPDVCCPLAAEGWHAIFLGLWKGGVTIRLSNDTAEQYVRPDHSGTSPVRFQEVFWKAADLTGQSLVIKHAPGLLQPPPDFGNNADSAIAYIRLVPLSPEQVTEAAAERNRVGAKRLIGANDLGTPMAKNRFFTTTANTLGQVEPYLNNDFEKLFLEFWHDGPDVTLYEQAIQHARQGDLELYLGRRMGAVPSVGPHVNLQDRDGVVLSRPSYAYPEQQERVLELFRTMLSYDPDGLALLFHKGVPFLLYEEPLLAAFEKETGTSPLDLAEDDAAWLRFRAGIMTGFLARLRQEADAYAKRQGGKRVRIAAYVWATEENNLFFGLDTAAWIKQGLVDEIIASYKYCPEAGARIGVERPDVKYLVKQAEDTPCRIYCDISGERYLEPAEYKRIARELYDQGVYAPHIWDAHTRHPLLRQWNMISRLGHRDQLEDWDDGEDMYHRDLKVKTIAGRRVNRWG